MEARDKWMLRVCYFGTYSMEEGYPRNRVIIEGLRRNGVDVVECHEDFWKSTEEKLKGVQAGQGEIKTLWRLMRTYARLVSKFRKVGNYDVLIVGYAGHIDIFLAKFLNLLRRKPVLFDAFLSVYDTAVMDRKIVRAGSLKAGLLRWIDTWACRMADAVLLDTQAHIDYFVREFHLPAKKFFAVPVGSSMRPSRPSLSQGGRELEEEMPPDLPSPFTVLYFGSYIPLHGVDIVLMAAKILQREEDILFTLIGKGQLLPEMKELASTLRLKNVHFIERFIKEEELTGYINQADACLGIFGKSDKAMRVVPCKVYNCLSMGRPLITAMTPATEGVLTHMENAILCRPGDPEDLADAILQLKNNAALRERIACLGQEYFRRHFSAEAIGEKVLEIIHGHICPK